MAFIIESHIKTEWYFQLVSNQLETNTELANTWSFFEHTASVIFINIITHNSSYRWYANVINNHFYDIIYAKMCDVWRCDAFDWEQSKLVKSNVRHLGKFHDIFNHKKTICSSLHPEFPFFLTTFNIKWINVFFS